jgi:G3E family GTPase
MCIFCERAAAQLLDGLTPSQRRAAEQCERLQERRVKATILTGFLGAGKTTFLNFVLKSLKHGQRIAVIQNEFGSVSIDDQLMPVERSNTEVVVMPNGCLCCRVRGDLVDALRRLSMGSAEKPVTGDEAPPLDGLIIECSGLSEVTPVAQTFFADPYVQASYRLDGVVCICDAANFDSFQESSDGDDVARLLREQLGLSDVVLVNKCDLVDSARRDALGVQIRSVNPSAKVVPCRHGKVNLQQVLTIGSFSLEMALSLDPHFLDDQRSSGNDGHGDGHGHGHSHGGDNEHGRQHAHDTFGSIGLEADEPINIASFKEWMKSVVVAHGTDIVRVKGVLITPSSAGVPKRVIVQGVGGHIEIGEELETTMNGTANKSRLVFIGRMTFEIVASLRAGFKGTVASLAGSGVVQEAVTEDVEVSARM